MINYIVKFACWENDAWRFTVTSVSSKNIRRLRPFMQHDVRMSKTFDFQFSNSAGMIFKVQGFIAVVSGDIISCKFFTNQTRSIIESIDEQGDR